MPESASSSLSSSTDTQTPRLPGRLLAGLPPHVQSVVCSQLVVGVRDLGEAGLLGLGYALTHNLAAVVVAGAGNALLMAAWQRSCRRGAARPSWRTCFAGFTP